MTTRRGFLQLLVASGVAASLPEAVALARPPKPAPPPGPLLSGQMGRYEGVRFHEPLKFKRFEEEFDFGHQRGMGVATTVNGVLYRHAALLHFGAYNALGERGRERIWQALEQKVTIFVRGASA